MNIYVVVEGEVGEKKLYEKWVPFINAELNYSKSINDVVNNNFFIQIGGGYPSYFDVIKSGIYDVKNIQDQNGISLFNRLVIVIDSEDYTFNQKMDEVLAFITPIIASDSIPIDVRIVIQHFCLETWALANKKIVTNNIQNLDLLKYIRIFNVAKQDPEELPELIEEDLNRAQFASKYLRMLLNNKFRNLSYSKSNPDVLLHKKYFNEVKDRYSKDQHIQSFQTLLNAFI